jgi:hypothetical protein
VKMKKKKSKKHVEFALLVQLCRALHHAALDGNSWGNAGLLMPTPDPSKPPIFAGPARQMMDIASYSKAQAERTKNQKPSDQGGEKEKNTKFEKKEAPNK